MPNRHKVRQIAIDCDPGIDDAMALALAAHSPDLELRAVTTVEGNVPLEQTTANALALLDLLGRQDVPVAAGADRGLVRTKPHHRAVHGPNGLGGIQLPSSARRRCEQDAAGKLAQLLADGERGSLTIVAIGPLTNLALLLSHYPEAGARVGRLVIMGGSVGPGNVTPAAEYNIWADPEAAARVLGSGLDIWLAQLQATRTATLDLWSRTTIATGSHAGSQLIAMMDGYDEGAGINPALHDVVPIAAVIDQQLVRLRPARIEVVTAQGPRRGETVIDFDGGGGAPVSVIVEVDVERLRRLLVERVGHPTRSTRP